MKLYSFFSGPTFIAEKFSVFYFYGNSTALITFRQQIIKWWFEKNGYSFIELDSIDDYMPEPSLFSGADCNDKDFLVLKKAPKNIDSINQPCFWSSSGTKSIAHDKALNSNKVASVACYDIKTDEILSLLSLYLEKEFSYHMKPSNDLKGLATLLSEEPVFFFSSAYKIAMGMDIKDIENPYCSEEEDIGALRLRSAMLLRQLKSSPNNDAWNSLMDIRKKELSMKGCDL